MPCYRRMSCPPTMGFMSESFKGHTVAHMNELFEAGSQYMQKNQIENVEKGTIESEHVPDRFLEGGDEKFDEALLYHASTRRTASLTLCIDYNRHCLKILNEVRRRCDIHNKTGVLSVRREPKQVVNTFMDLMRIGLRGYFGFSFNI